MKKLLVIACYFPPSGEVGAVRATKFVKYLLRMGWDITILTVEDKYYKTFNYEWLAEVKGARIIRTRVTGPRIFFKDIGTYWPFHLFRALRSLLSSEKFDISLWTGNPFYHLFLAPYCKQKYSLKYILEFRDPWKYDAYRWRTRNVFQLLKNAIDNAISRVLEPIVIGHAERVINVNDYLTAVYSAAYPSSDPEKFVTIQNGFDRPDFGNIAAVSNSRFDIVYSGKFGAFRDPSSCLRGFKLLIEERKLAPQDISFIWIGKPEGNVIRLIKRLDLNAYVRQVGYQPYRESLRFIKGAGVCLLVSAGHPSEGTTKVFDYMALRKSILVVGAAVAGNLREMLKDYADAYFTIDDPHRIVEALTCLMENKPSQTDNDRCFDDTLFSREYHTELLDRMLSEICDGDVSTNSPS